MGKGDLISLGFGCYLGGPQMLFFWHETTVNTPLHLDGIKRSQRV